MSLSLFDIVGPIMIGPSSSHTAGAVRIGYMARLILGEEPKNATLYFHPVLMQTYAGHRTHAALVAGLLGYREDDLKCASALEEAKNKGIAISVEPIGNSNGHQNTMRIRVRAGDRNVVVNGISVGGGSILISEIDGVPVDLDGNTYVLLLRSKRPCMRQFLDQLIPYQVVGTFAGQTSDGFLVCCCLRHAVPNEVLSSIRDSVLDSSVRLVSPLYDFCPTNAEKPLFSTLAQLIKLAEGSTLPQVAIDYERIRSGRTKEMILNNMCNVLAVMHTAVEEGLAGKARLLGGFCSGNDGWRLMRAHNEGKTITRGVFATALARALAVVEMNAAMGKVVAAPTAGSAGVLPGVLFSVGEQLNKSKEDLLDAVLVAAAVGVCIANKASLSGAVGGCQGEVGVAAAIAASAATYLGGGGAEACVHAAALTLKNMLGLICDPAAGPVEVPCIKRNAVGVSAALMGAEMALAGIKSYIPPDEVVDALVNVQRLLPQELKGSTIGGLGCTRTAAEMKAKWQCKLKQLEGYGSNG